MDRNMDLSRNKLGGNTKEAGKATERRPSREGGRAEQGSQGAEPSLQLPQTPDPFDITLYLIF